MKHPEVIKRPATSHGAYGPELPAWVAGVETKAEVYVVTREARELYIKALNDNGHPIPSPQQYEPVAPSLRRHNSKDAPPQLGRRCR